MNIRKFQAATMREALAQVKSQLGPDAMVVATRQIRRGLMGAGVEVTAAMDSDDVDAPEAVAQAQAPRGPAAPGSASTVAPIARADVDQLMAPLRSELRSLRSLIRSAADARRNDDLRAEMAALRQSLAGMGIGAGDDVTPHDHLAAEAAATSLENLASTATIAAPPERRIVALVGPTGVGKTTTIAKLAGSAALIERKSVAIVSLDTYRVGGEEQVRIFAELVGAPLHLVTEPEHLPDAISACGDADHVYIDTAGRSPRDTGAIRGLEEALRRVPDAEIHLTVAASTEQLTVDAIYRRYATVGIDRLLFTKLDEAEDLTLLVRAPARLRRPVGWVTTGQRIPEDYEEATAERLLNLATGGLATMAAVA